MCSRRIWYREIWINVDIVLPYSQNRSTSGFILSQNLDLTIFIEKYDDIYDIKLALHILGVIEVDIVSYKKIQTLNSLT